MKYSLSRNFFVNTAKSSLKLASFEGGVSVNDRPFISKLIVSLLNSYSSNVLPFRAFQLTPAWVNDHQLQ